MNSAIKQRRPPFTAEERESWIWRFRSSGLTQVQFAQPNGLKLKTLQRWLYRQGSIPVRQQRQSAGWTGKRVGQRSEAAAIFPRNGQRPKPVAFREVPAPSLWAAPAGTAWAAEVTWPSGVTVRLGAGAEAAWIGAVLAAVRRAC